MLDPESVRRIKQIRICEIARERGVIVPQRRAEQQRTRAIDHDREMREMAGIAIVKTLCATRAGNCVAALVEYAKGITVLERQRPKVLERSLGGNRERLVLFRRAASFQTRWSDRCVCMLRLRNVDLLPKFHGSTAALGRKQGRRGLYRINVGLSRRLSGETGSKPRRCARITALANGACTGLRARAWRLNADADCVVDSKSARVEPSGDDETSA